MTLGKQVWALMRKDFQLEWRNRYALNGILLYLVLIVFLAFLAFQKVEPKVWNGLLWLILLFTAVNGIAKSFLQEPRSRDLYYYTLISPKALILGKMIYSLVLMLVVALLAVVSYSLVLGWPVIFPIPFVLALVFGSIGLAATFTMVAGIASRAHNSPALMAILSLPLFVPMLMALLALSLGGFRPMPDDVILRNTLVIVALDGVVFGLALLLFPYIWRE